MDPDQIFRQHETEKKRQYASRVLEVEQTTFTPLVFSTTGGMAVECKRYHSRFAELVAMKKGEKYATTMSRIREKSILCSPEHCCALLCIAQLCNAVQLLCIAGIAVLKRLPRP